VLVVGAGPAGASAALLGAELSIDVLLVDPAGIGGRMAWISRATNIPGFRSGTAFAQSLAEQVQAAATLTFAPIAVEAAVPAETTLCVKLRGGGTIRAEHVIWCTGLRPVRLDEHPSVSIEPGTSPSEVTLIGPRFDELTQSSALVVVGCDRPLQTFLQCNPGAARRTTALCLPGEEYKVAAVQQLYPHLTVSPVWTLRVLGDTRLQVVRKDGTLYELRGSIITNLGSCPVSNAVKTVTEQDDAGYIVASRTRRLVAAGDVAHASHQRVSVALGDGARAMLDYYYRREHAHGW
jgi:thioredoxin reductase